MRNKKNKEVGWAVQVVGAADGEEKAALRRGSRREATEFEPETENTLGLAAAAAGECGGGKKIRYKERGGGVSRRGRFRLHGYGRPHALVEFGVQGARSAHRHTRNGKGKGGISSG